MRNLKLPEWLQASNEIDGDGDGDVEMTISAPIGFDPETYDGISANAFGQTLSQLKGRKVKLNINTLGGSVPEGTSMFNMAMAHGDVHTNVIGYAASIGALIFQAGKTRTMQPGTMLIVHNPHTTPGTVDAAQLQSELNVMKVLKNTIVDAMATRTGQKKSDISDMMDAVTAMGPKEALKAGFCDAIGTGENVTNSVAPEALFKICRHFNSASLGASVGGGSTAKTDNKHSNMKLLEKLAALKLIPSADMTEDAAAVAVEASVAGLTEQRTVLQTENGSHRAALELRVKNRVQKAVDDKKVKPERQANLLALGLIAENNLDFLDDIVVAPVAGAPDVRRGSPPAPIAKHDNSAETLDSVRAKMKTETNPVEIGRLARQARDLRGHENLFRTESPKHVVIDGKAHPIAG